MSATDRSSRPSTDFARSFIDQRATTFHEAFGIESYFNTAMSRYESKEAHDLEEVLKKYQRQAPDEADIDFDPLRCSWNDVFYELERAQAAVVESENNGKKFHRRVWRGLGISATVLAPALVGIPNNLSVLQGGLAVVFSLARQRTLNRHKILHAFEDIPNVIIMAYGKTRNIPPDHPESARLHGMIGALQQTLISAIPVLIEGLNPKTFREKVKNPFEEFKFDDLLADIRCSSDRVRACAEQVMDGIVVSTHQTVRNNHQMSNGIHVITNQTREEVGQLRGIIEEIAKQQKSFQSTLDAVSSKNSLLGFVMEILKKEQPEGDKSPTEDPPVYEPATAVTPREVLTWMNVHHLGALHDEQRIIQHGQASLDGDAISHAATMLQNSKVQGFLQSPDSGVLLVNGCTDRSQSTKLSSITYVSATLTHGLRRSPSTNVVLAFFCGQHSASQDDLAGPQGLMRRLVADLVLSLAQNNCIQDEAPIWFPASEEHFERLSFEDICLLFRHLVELVPKNLTVYCVVDGISHYEREFWKEEYDMTMRNFGTIVGNNATATTFKLLLTSPTKSLWLPDLNETQRVSLRDMRTRTGRGMNPEAVLQSAFGNLM